MRALFPSTDGTLLPVTDTESNFNVFPNESVVFKSADLAARQELDKTVRTTATRQPHVRFIKFKRIFKSHTPAKLLNNLDNPKLRGIRSAERIFFVNLKIIGGMAIGDSKIINGASAIIRTDAPESLALENSQNSMIIKLHGESKQ